MDICFVNEGEYAVGPIIRHSYLYRNFTDCGISMIRIDGSNVGQGSHIGSRFFYASLSMSNGVGGILRQANIKGSYSGGIGGKDVSRVGIRDETLDIAGSRYHSNKIRSIRRG